LRKRLLLGFVVAAITTSAWSAQPHVAIVQPSAGAVLRGGEFATISWSAVHPFEAEEWEAFLSVDGGRYYSARLTPHLDIRIRTFTFIVPNVSSDDVRLLIRTGDEREETIVEFPQRYSIRATASPNAGVPSSGRGESARPGDAPVVLWNTGRSIEWSVEAKATIAGRRSSRDRQALAAPALSNEITEVELSAESDRGPQTAAFAPREIPSRRDILRLVHRLNI
jgi:hypothetical protein